MCTSTPTTVPSGQTRIFIRRGVETACEASIQNRHFDPVGKKSYSEISGAAPKFLSGSAIGTPRRSKRALVSRNSVPGQKFTPGACISTPTVVPSNRTQIFIRPGVGTAREAPIQNRQFDPVSKRSHSEISGPAPKFLSGSAVAASTPSAKELGITFRTGIAIAYATTIWNRDSETVDRALAADAIAYGHPFAQTGITFRSIIEIAYKTPI
ncbi:hypothetical protein Taro_030888 [Colocasia esculenta]|uniref:Uncharacterized protein n=1 Tax=Colocasia esculenta TaxID=4460 RepID=A0A843W4N3_COLES|nr:hypothetical protein [Colocasia esculenta]